MRTWGRLGELLARAARGSLRVYVLPLRVAWNISDRLIFAWWWWGQEDEGASRWRWYKFIEDAWTGFYLTLYVWLWGWIYRNVGE